MIFLRGQFVAATRTTMLCSILVGSFVITTVSALSIPSSPLISVERKATTGSPFVIGTAESLTVTTCKYERAILLSHPSSLGKDDRYYVLGSQMLEAAHATIDQINSWPRCGVSLDGKNYSLTIRSIGDDSDENRTAQIGHQIVNDQETDFMLAGYSSKLTRNLSPVAQDNQMLMVAAGASSTYIYEDRDYAVSLLPPSSLYLDNPLRALSDVGAKSVAYIRESNVNTCVSAPDVAAKYGLDFLGGIEVTKGADYEEFEAVAKNMTEINPDIMVVCMWTGFRHWNQALRKFNWSPKAHVFTLVIGTPEFESEMGEDYMPGIMGVASWARSLPPVSDEATGWTPADFDTVFEQVAFRRPAYQHTAQSAAISVLVQGMERVGSLNVENFTERVRDEIVKGHFPTVYGNVSFDENGMSASPYLLLQYDEASQLHVMEPLEVKTTDFQLMYPLPTWMNRDCNIHSNCAATNGTCSTDGTCDCPQPLMSSGEGRFAQCLPATSDSQSTLIMAIAIPVVAVVIIAVAVLLHMKISQRRNDALWKVSRKEIVFADPPEIIGRGSFGLVLKAELRGCEVAVKRVLPPAPQNRKGSMSRTSSDQSPEHHQMSITNGSMSTGVTSSRKGMSSMLGLSSVHGMQDIGKLLGLEGVLNKKKNKTRSTKKSGSGTKTHRMLKKEFIEEMRYLSKLRHPCITTVMGAVIDEKNDPLMIMEYMHHGSLYDILHNQTFHMEASMLLPILRDISQGCRFLHAADLVHGDLKAANVLVDNKFRAKLADFGLSQKKNLGGTGTPFWMAPELLRQESSNTSASDVYSFGMVLYEVYSRKDPYEGEGNAVDVLRLVADKRISKRPVPPRNCPSQLIALMNECLLDNADERPPFDEIDHRIKRLHKEKPEPEIHSQADKNSQISLFDIFPKHVAEALRQGKKVEPEHHDCVTIFFSDIVGFTTIASTLDPRKVANLLDRLYRKFDALADKYSIFKVETIGDAYMCVTNLVKNQPDHTKRIAEFSIEAVRAANETFIDEDDPSKGFVEVRCGFHSGAVVADVVGTRNVRYCLFGDAVNTASRMESNSLANRIHCSKAAADLLKIQFPGVSIKSRGMINVKGKGSMETYWVNAGVDTNIIEQDIADGDLPILKSLPSTIEEESADLDVEAQSVVTKGTQDGMDTSAHSILRLDSLRGLTGNTINSVRQRLSPDRKNVAPKKKVHLGTKNKHAATVGFDGQVVVQQHEKEKGSLTSSFYNLPLVDAFLQYEREKECRRSHMSSNTSDEENRTSSCVSEAISITQDRSEF